MTSTAPSLADSSPYPIADAGDFSVNSDSSSDFLISVRGFYCLAFHFRVVCLLRHRALLLPWALPKAPSKEETERDVCGRVCA